MKRKYCKNGNIHLTLEPQRDYIDDSESTLINAYYLIDNGDTMFLYSDYYGFEFYDMFTNKKYTIDENTAETIMSGKRVILYPQLLDEWDIDFLATEYEFIVD